MEEKPAKHGSFSFVVEEVEYTVDHPLITGGEIMDMAGIPRDVGLILICDDGTQEVVKAEQRLNLAELRGRFKRSPRFRRG